jgi:2-dehydro-3-deoxyphosphogluconate aldolase/(4S)-4-hydroxy-2-oxoglutarate aldolase
MIDVFNSSGIPFLPGVSTPSEIIQGLNRGWTFFKFFPADLFGGIKALKTYGAIFSQAKFCPTGGINGENANDFLQLNNVLSVGGSWLLSD